MAEPSHAIVTGINSTPAAIGTGFDSDRFEVDRTDGFQIAGASSELVASINRQVPLLAIG